MYLDLYRTKNSFRSANLPCTGSDLKGALKARWFKAHSMSPARSVHAGATIQLYTQELVYGNSGRVPRYSSASGPSSRRKGGAYPEEQLADDLRRKERGDIGEIPGGRDFHQVEADDVGSG